MLTNENISAIIERVQNHDLVETIARWLEATNGKFKGLSPIDSSYFMIAGSDNEMDDNVSPRFRWSLVTANEDTFTLYFTWVHPFHMLFDEHLFVYSYQKRSKSFCLSYLVNAICAIACYYHIAVDADVIDFELLGRNFSDAVRHKLDAEDQGLLSIQAFAIMFLVGKGLYASKYLAVANSLMASLKCVGDDIYQRAWRCTARGIRDLNVFNVSALTVGKADSCSEWAQMTFRVLPVVNETASDDSTPDSEERDMQIDEIRWRDWYPSLMAITNQEKAKLLDIVYDIEVLLYSSGGLPISVFIIWREDLLCVIDNTINKHTQLLLYAISMLILYYTAVVQLLRPLLDVKGFPIYLVDHIIRQYIQYSLFLLEEHYHILDICRYQPVVQMFAILHLTDMIVRFFPNIPYNHGKDGPVAVQLAIDVLAKSRPGFPVAGTFLELIHKTAKDVIIPLPINLEESFYCSHPGRSRFLLDDTIDTCTRTTYIQPVYSIQMRFSPMISSDWVATCAAFGFRYPGPNAVGLGQLSAEKQGAQNLMQITNPLNMN
ncbi:nitrogen assimilation transcription factor nirA protein [Rutstroemia sp. NJR-2017a BVV2]|nr:nitrogen assimilation transcription factor nirA protein [Rutstroemia sp. NJR-2017a BVV2]